MDALRVQTITRSTKFLQMGDLFMNFEQSEQKLIVGDNTSKTYALEINHTI